MTSILHIVRNPVSHDSRVLKETGSILGKFPDKELVSAGFHEPGYAEKESIGQRQVHRWRLATRPLPKNLLSQSIKYMEWYIRLIKAYRKEPLQIIHCHDIEPLAIAVRLKKITGAKLIYDAHELETERNGSRGIRQSLTQWQEARWMPYVDHLITVSPSIEKWYAQRYPDTPRHLVRNIPQEVDVSVLPITLRKSLAVPDNALLFLYLGGLSKGRGIETILESFTHDSVPHHVLFMGSGALEEQVKRQAEACERIHYRSPVPPAEVTSYAAGADVGLSLIEDTCLSYRYCLPNKLFENMLAGLPVLASDLPDQRQVIIDHQAG